MKSPCDVSNRIIAFSPGLPRDSTASRGAMPAEHALARSEVAMRRDVDEARARHQFSRAACPGPRHARREAARRRRDARRRRAQISAIAPSPSRPATSASRGSWARRGERRVVCRDIGRIRDDRIEARRTDRLEPGTAQEAHVADAEPLRIASGDLERGGARIHCRHAASVALAGDGERDRAAARAEIEHGGPETRAERRRARARPRVPSRAAARARRA